MKNSKNSSKKKVQKIITGIIATSIALLLFVACQKDGSMTPLDSADDYSSASYAKKTTPSDENDATYNYPQSGSIEVPYWDTKNIYRGTGINIPNGSNFSFSAGALTPPSDMPFGAAVTITMDVEKDETNNELIFTFGPSGCSFDPAAEVVFDWTDLGIESATLYYIDNNGNYVPQTPASTSIKNKKMLIYVDHFSRYAVGLEP
jgi:hypothetical protein